MTYIYHRDYKTCKDCGANLDFEEHCDCDRLVDALSNIPLNNTIPPNAIREKLGSPPIAYQNRYFR